MKIHFIGIGGIGVSALARYYLTKGCEISGSDLVSSEITEALEKLRAKVFIGKHKVRNLPKDVNMVIYSPAVPSDNPELKSANYRSSTSMVKVLSYPKALGELTKKYFTIAISGTHGKSTTCAMIGLILEKAGLDPTIIVGTKLREFGDSNCRVGKSKYLVIEADEWRASFLNYWPRIIVLTNIEKEHLDFYKDLNHILKTYRRYICHLPKNGILVINKDNKNIHNTFLTAVKKVLWYSLKDWESKKLRKFLKIPGDHNVSNALAALTVARALKIPDKISFKALSKYKGAWRRFETKKLDVSLFPGGLKRKITFISDYGHHPTEIKATLTAAREKYPKKEIWCIFQPHQYQRTYYLFNDFVGVFKETPIEKLIITDIYDVAGRESADIKKKVSSQKLVLSIKHRVFKKKEVLYIPTVNEVRDYLKKNLWGREVVIIMGAGDIYKLCEQF